jgi:TfoX/Sxy family transcriptional regulator of competence genes
MASDQEFVDFVTEQLRGVRGVSHRKMFGEYALYIGEKVVALICDNQLFVKPTAAGRAVIGSPAEVPPYKGAKPFFLVGGELDDTAFLTRLILATESEVPKPKPKARRKGKPILKAVTAKQKVMARKKLPAKQQ